MMELVFIGLFTALIIVIFWPNIKMWWNIFIKHHLVGNFDDEKFKAPFCFDCNELSCEGCKAYKKFVDEGDDSGWAEFLNMKYGKKVDKQIDI